MSEELKPCPFCGNKENLQGPLYAESLSSGSWWIECESCEIVVERDLKSELIRFWNTRHEDQRIADLEAELSKYRPRSLVDADGKELDVYEDEPKGETNDS